MIKNLLIIGSGGFVGSIARYLVSMLNLNVSFHSIPIGTLTVNVTGSLIIGALTGIVDRSMILITEWSLSHASLLLMDNTERITVALSCLSSAYG